MGDSLIVLEEKGLMSVAKLIWKNRSKWYYLWIFVDRWSVLCCFGHILIMLIGLLRLRLIQDTAFGHCEVLSVVDIRNWSAVFDVGLGNSLIALPYLEGLCGPNILLCSLVQLKHHWVKIALLDHDLEWLFFILVLSFQYVAFSLEDSE